MNNKNKNHNIILIAHKNMIEFLGKENSKQFGLDFAYKINPTSYKPYKLLTIYSFNEKENKIAIGALICVKSTDIDTLKKLFSFLRISYNFSPIMVNTDFNRAQIKALKTCEFFEPKPYVVLCLFHYSKTIIELKIFKKKLNKKSYELLKNLEILAFIDIDKITLFIEFYKEHIFLSENEKNFLSYYENTWIKKFKNIFNYSFLINDILKIKNVYKNNEGKNNSEKELISKLKSLNKVYCANNICESIHSKISKYLGNNKVIKAASRDTLNFILNEYEFKISNIQRRDYVTRILIYSFKISIK